MTSSVSSRLSSAHSKRVALDVPVFQVTPEVESSTFEDIKEQCKLIYRAELTKEIRFINQVLRALPLVRRRLTFNVVSRLVNYYFVGPEIVKLRQQLMSFIRTPGNSSTSSKSSSKRDSSSKKTKRGPDARSLLPEIETYLHLLVVLFLFQERQLQKAISCCKLLTRKLATLNRRLLDPLSAKVYFFYALIYEKEGKLSTCLAFLQSRLRVATLRHDSESHASLINCILRLYVLEKSFKLASTVIEASRFPPSADVYQWARFHYYTGWVHAVERKYEEARQALLLALKKAPKQVASGFRYAVLALLITIELLLGHSPNRQTFKEGSCSSALEPYLQLAHAVGTGDVKLFNEIVKIYVDIFDGDQTLNFVIHLKQSVMKVAIRQLCLAYRRISITNISKKLQFDNPNDAVVVLSKAIKDKTINAVLDDYTGCLEVTEEPDLYLTPTPQMELNLRIQFLLELHSQTIKAMRFPPKAEPKEIETIEQKREREKNELEYAKEFASDDEDYT